MGFRRKKSDAHRHLREWQAWIDCARSELATIGLPAEVYLNEGRWLDFLENGHLHWHESSGFAFDHLTAAQLAALHRFLDREYGEAEKTPYLLGYVRSRLNPL